MTRETLRSIVHDSSGRSGRALALAIQTLILLSLVTFSVETLPDLSPSSRTLLRLVEIITVGIFTLEYVVRLAVAERPLRFVFSFLGLVDLLAIAPFYVAAGLDLRAIRVVRLLRLFRLLKLVRYSQAIRRVTHALRIAREELVLFFSVAAIVTYVAAVGIYYFENPSQPDAFRSVFDSLWWAIVTLTTVGYGDIYPITAGGRIFTVVILVVGLGIVAVPTGIMASALSEARRAERDRGA